MTWMQCIHGKLGPCDLCQGCGSRGIIGTYTCKHGNGYGCSQCMNEQGSMQTTQTPPVKLPAPVLAEPVKVDKGWQCPVCRVVWAPSVRACKCATGEVCKS